VDGTRVYNLSGSSVYQEADLSCPLTPQAIRVLGVTPRRLHDCQYHDGLLTCTIVDDRTGVWGLSAS